MAMRVGAFDHLEGFGLVSNNFGACMTPNFFSGRGKALCAPKNHQKSPLFLGSVEGFKGKQ
jgi:hypothetical protein